MTNEANFQGSPPDWRLRTSRSEEGGILRPSDNLLSHADGIHSGSGEMFPWSGVWLPHISKKDLLSWTTKTPFKKPLARLRALRAQRQKPSAFGQLIALSASDSSRIETELEVNCE